MLRSGSRLVLGQFEGNVTNRVSLSESKNGGFGFGFGSRCFYSSSTCTRQAPSMSRIVSTSGRMTTTKMTTTMRSVQQQRQQHSQPINRFSSSVYRRFLTTTNNSNKSTTQTTTAATTSAKTTTTTTTATNGSSSSSASSSSSSSSSSFREMLSSKWKQFVGPKPMPERWTAAWYKEVTLICTVFAITGSSTMVLVRPAVSNGLGLKGSMKDGPWSYRICSLVIMTPIYATLLVCVGTVFGRHFYFKHFSVKMWSRFGIPPEMLDESYHITKKNFRKW